MLTLDAELPIPTPPGQHSSGKTSSHATTGGTRQLTLDVLHPTPSCIPRATRPSPAAKVPATRKHRSSVRESVSEIAAAHQRSGRTTLLTWLNRSQQSAGGDQQQQQQQAITATRGGGAYRHEGVITSTGAIDGGGEKMVAVSLTLDAARNVQTAVDYGEPASIAAPSTPFATVNTFASNGIGTRASNGTTFQYPPVTPQAVYKPPPLPQTQQPQQIPSQPWSPPPPHQERQRLSSQQPTYQQQQPQSEQERHQDHQDEQKRQHQRAHPSLPHPTLQNIQYHPITESNITRLRQLNSLLFPVRYNDKFYRDVLHVHPADLSCLAFLERLPIGAISCRKEPLYPATDPRHDPRHCRVYIMTLGVLSPYRRLRVGSALLGRVEEAAGKDAGVVELALHVQTSNTQALRFYERHGFVKATMVKDYYIKNNVQPPDAWVLRKSVRVARNGRDW